MLSASLFIITHSARNRLRLRLRRLREPRYLIGAVAGALYFYFTVFARLRGRRSAVRGGTGRGAPIELLSAVRAAAPAAGGVVLLVLSAVSWLLPFDAGLLDFSEAEMQFLFPAPVSRRGLLLHRMMRSQLGILFGSVLFSLFAPTVSGYSRVRSAVGVWLMLSAAKIYVTGVALSRGRLGAADRRARFFAWLPIAIIATAVIVVGAAIANAVTAGPPSSIQEALVRVGMATRGAAGVFLWPFAALVNPLFAEWPIPYFEALAGSLAVLAVCVAWVLQSDDLFQDAAVEAADRKASRPSTRAPQYRARGTAWNLQPAGRPEVAFVWKAVLQTLRIIDPRTMFRLVSILAALTVAASAMGGRSKGLAAVLGIFSVVASGFAILMAPQVVRMDMRQDLRHLEVLKTWPVNPAAVIRGEMIWPGVVITAIAWAAIAIATFLSATNFSHIALAWRLSVAGAAAVLAPALIFAQLTVHNGVALLFPAWISVGNQRARGFDAMGQRIVMLGATWLTLIVMALPGALVGAVVWFGLKFFVGVGAVVPAAAVCSVILAMEVLVATEALGPAYERLDLTAVERAE